MLSSTAGLSEEEALNDMKNLADDLANKDRLSGPFRDDLHEFAECFYLRDNADMILFMFSKVLKVMKQQDDAERDRKDDRKTMDDLTKIVISQADLTEDEKIAVRASSNKMVAQPGRWNFGTRQDTFDDIREHKLTNGCQSLIDNPARFSKLKKYAGPTISYSKKIYRNELVKGISHPTKHCGPFKHTQRIVSRFLPGETMTVEHARQILVLRAIIRDNADELGIKMIVASIEANDKNQEDERASDDEEGDEPDDDEPDDDEAYNEQQAGKNGKKKKGKGGGKGKSKTRTAFWVVVTSKLRELLKRNGSEYKAGEKWKEFIDDCLKYERGKYPKDRINDIIPLELPTPAAEDTIDVPRPRIRVEPRRVVSDVLRVPRPLSSLSTQDVGRTARHAPYPQPRRATDIHASFVGPTRHHTPPPLNNPRGLSTTSVSSFGEVMHSIPQQTPTFYDHQHDAHLGNQHTILAVNGTSTRDEGSERTIIHRNDADVWRGGVNAPYEGQ